MAEIGAPPIRYRARQLLHTGLRTLSASRGASATLRAILPTPPVPDQRHKPPLGSFSAWQVAEFSYFSMSTSEIMDVRWKGSWDVDAETAVTWLKYEVQGLV